jgi:transposase
LPSSEVRELNELVSRRLQLVDLQTQEKNRLEHVEGYTLKDVGASIAWLGNRIVKIDKEIAGLVSKSETLKPRASLLRGVKGIGEVVSSLLLAKLPELGNVSNKAIASLVGVAPYAQDSGKMKGKRVVSGGRATVRSGLYMSTLSAIRYNPQIKHFYERLTRAGKSKKLAITACMRKLLVTLNAMVKHSSEWDATKGLQAECL